MADVMAFLIENAKIIVPCCISLLGGFLLAKYSKRTRIIKYWSKVSRIGFSASDNIFGNIVITHNERPVNSIFYIEMWLQNDSGVDVKDFSFNTYGNLKILGEYRRILNSPSIFDWSDDFKRSIAIPDNACPTEYQISRYFGNREYFIKVLNRGETLKLELLVESTDGGVPTIFADARIEGVKLKYIIEGPKVHGEEIRYAAMIAIILIILATNIFLYYMHVDSLRTMILVVVVAFAQSLAAMLIKLYRRVRVLFN